MQTQCTIINQCNHMSTMHHKIGINMALKNSDINYQSNVINFSHFSFLFPRKDMFLMPFSDCQSLLWCLSLLGQVGG